MRGKKKGAQSVQEKQPQNKPKTIITSDGKEYKVMDSVLMKHSGLCKVMLEDDKNDEQIKLLEVDAETFEYINEFMQMYKDKQVVKITFPIKSNQDIKYVMDESDAAFIEKIMLKGDELFKKVLDGASYMQVEELKIRLITGMTVSLMKCTVDELKIKYDIKQGDLNEEELRKEVREKLELIAEIKDE